MGGLTDLGESFLSTNPGTHIEMEVPEVPQPWYFTFGYGQRLYIGHRDQADVQGEGIPLDECYVILDGTFAQARERMITLFGRMWCAQYNQLPPIYPGGTWRLIDLSTIMAGRKIGGSQ